MDADQNIVCLEYDYLLYLATHLLLLFLLLSLYLPYPCIRRSERTCTRADH